MKKILLTMLCVGVALPAMAKNHNKGGFVFVPQNVAIETVQDVKNKSDDTFVVMQGKIAKALGDDKYAFTDKTGEIVIEIDNDEFNGVTVMEGEMLEISGDVDKEMMKDAKVDVKTIKKLNHPAKK